MDATYSVIRNLLLCFLILHSSLAQSNEKVSLQLRWQHQAQFIGFYVAQHKGFYQEAGLDVDIREGGPETIPWKAIANRKADFAVGNTFAFIAFSQNQPIVAISAIFQHSPAALVTLASSGIETLSDIPNRNLMLQDTPHTPALHAMLRKNNISLRDANLFTAETSLASLLEGTVDIRHIYTSNEPYLLQQSEIPYTLFKPLDYGIDFYGDLIITHRDRVLNNPRQVEAFRAASLKGWQYALDHPEDALALLEQQSVTEKSRDHARFEFNTLRPLLKPAGVQLGEMTTSRWTEIAQTLRSLKMISTAPKDVSRFIYDARHIDDLRKSVPWMMVSIALLIMTLICAVLLLLTYRRWRNEKQTRLQSELRIRHLAAHDPLTQLPNRTALIEQLTMLLKLAHRHHTAPALFYIDIDGFKKVNESLGHQSGDELLIKFANRIRGSLRESDIFGRLGSDEFLLIVDESTEEGCSQLAMKVMEALSKPFLINQQDVRISASIGIARYTDCGENADELIRRADKAMYKVKDSFKAGFSVAHPPISQRNTDLS